MKSYVGYNPETGKLSSSEVVVAGAISGFCTRLLTQPFDVVKIRQQLQVEATVGRNRGLYYDIFQSLYTIFKQEGFKALWKGHVSCQMLTMGYGSTQFYAYNILSKHCHELDITIGTQQALCGAIAGSSGTIVSMPFDIARTRIIAQSHKQYTGIIDVWLQMVAKDGITSLWRGLTPTFFMIIPASAIQFRSYGYLVQALSNSFPNGDQFIGVWIPMIAGGIAGLVSKFSVYPLDVLKKRIHILGSENIRNNFGKIDTYKDTLHCAMTVCRNEGLFGWYKGVTPALLKSSISSSMIFVFYEASCHFLQKASNNDSV